MKAQNSTLLIVDDDENDRFFFEREFQKLAPHYTIRLLQNGDEAIAYIRGDGQYRDRTKFQFPSYIISDLKMALGDGFHLLNHIRSNPALSIIPVVMLSGSEDPDDIRHAYLLGASSFFTKPSNPAAVTALIRDIHHYWAQCQVPAVDRDGYAILTDSTGKAGARYPKPQRYPAA